MSPARETRGEEKAAAAGPSPDSDRAELAEYIRRNVVDVRLANGLVLAWFRVALRIVTLALYAYAWVRYREAPMPVGIGINLVHILVAVGVLWFLLRRRSMQAALYAGALSDFAAVFIGAWRAAGRPDAETGTVYFMGVFELMLLFAALTLPRRAVGLLAFTCCAYLALLAARSEMPVSSASQILVTLVAFSLAVTWAGARLVDLAARTAVEAYSGKVIRRHRDELQRAEEALRRAQAQAQTLTQLIVHDLRNPVATVGLSLEALGPAVELPEAAEALQIAREETERLSEMIGDLLVVSRLEEGLAAEAAPVEVKPLLVSAVRAAEARAGSAVRLEVRAPEARASLDGPLVRRMIDNLLSNAIRHVGEGDRIELSAEPLDAGLRIAVRNTGPPVPEEARAYIFEKHVSQGRRDWRNAGLGLYLCRLVAEAHGGSIAVRDRPGWNVSFEADLPAAPG
ncbi:MAG TPA: HAMP domain-containing sensor histidine kinase [Anaeromyxobacteraceae bacterium]|nr:HAMP domain-containing sensor histidine kinase [Anaeromyxobacteraceae bacterium]